jgi:Transposase DDE domain group 1
VLTVYGHQERAEVGFNPKKHGRPSYLPLLCLEGETQDCWEGSYHPGNTHVSTITVPMLERAFAKLPEAIHEVRGRADGAFFDHKIIEFIEQKHWSYAIVARLTGPLKARLSGLRFQRIPSGVWAAEFRYCPHGWPGTRRFVVIRRPVPEEPSAQLHLFQMGGYSYQVLVTDLSLTPLHRWRFYNQRARAELIIRELKDAYSLGKIPTKDFAANETFFQIVLLAYNLLNWFKRLCVPAHLQRATLQRLRQRLFPVPAQLVRPGGVPTLRLAPSYPYASEFLETLRRIRRLRSPFTVN